MVGTKDRALSAVVPRGTGLEGSLVFDTIGLFYRTFPQGENYLPSQVQAAGSDPRARGHTFPCPSGFPTCTGSSTGHSGLHSKSDNCISDNGPERVGSRSFSSL